MHTIPPPTRLKGAIDAWTEADGVGGTANFHVAGNSRRFVDWASVTFGTPFTYLPNLYFLEGPPDHYRPPFHGGLLRVGAFGATRPLKNLMSAAGAALTISRFFGGDLELWINSGRDEGAGCIVRAIEEMFRITRHAHLVRAGWASWHDHRKTVARMNLLINCSYTESFNMVTADGIAEGIPSVVSDAICWAPAYRRAPVDDVLEITRVGRHLLCERMQSQALPSPTHLVRRYAPRCWHLSIAGRPMECRKRRTTRQRGCVADGPRQSARRPPRQYVKT